MNIYDFPQVTRSLEIDPSRLGCVMLRLHSSELIEGQDYEPEWLYSDPNCPPWMQGIPDPHVTLLYGLLEPAYRFADEIREVMDGWVPPRFMTSCKYGAFGPVDAPYRAIVARIDADELLDAHDRLSLLPHCDTFSPYEPHVTLAYVHREYATNLVNELNAGLLGVENTKMAFIPDMSHGLDLGVEPSS